MFLVRCPWMKAQGMSQLGMCKKFDRDGVKTPANTEWKELSWSEAYLSREYQSSVKKWLSKAGGQW
jgi:hypothetical protein